MFVHRLCYGLFPLLSFGLQLVSLGCPLVSSGVASIVLLSPIVFFASPRLSLGMVPLLCFGLQLVSLGCPLVSSGVASIVLLAPPIVFFVFISLSLVSVPLNPVNSLHPMY